MANINSELNNVLIIGDSHAKCFHQQVTEPNYKITTTSISGLQLINSYDNNLFFYYLLKTKKFETSLATTDAVIFLIGTNSVRIMAASDIIYQIKTIILYIRKYHSH